MTLDQTRYEFAKWGAELGLSAMFDFFAVAGKPFAAVGAAMATGEGLKTEVNQTLVKEAFEAVFASLATQKDTCMRLIKNLSTVDVLADGKQIASFNAYYGGRLSHLRKVVMAAGEVQLGDFLGELTTLRQSASAGKATTQAP